MRGRQRLGETTGGGGAVGCSLQHPTVELQEYVLVHSQNCTQVHVPTQHSGDHQNHWHGSNPHSVNAGVMFSGRKWWPSPNLTFLMQVSSNYYI